MVWVLMHFREYADCDCPVGVTADESVARAWEALPDHSIEEFNLGDIPEPCGCRVYCHSPIQTEPVRYFIGSFDNQVSKEEYDKAVTA